MKEKEERYTDLLVYRGVIVSTEQSGSSSEKQDKGLGKSASMLSEDLLEGWLLLFLSKDSLHGYALAKKLEQVSQSVPHQTTIYRHLDSMEERRLLDSKWKMRESSPPVRIYRLTEKGKQRMRKVYTRVSRLHRLCRDFLQEASKNL